MRNSIFKFAASAVGAVLLAAVSQAYAGGDQFSVFAGSGYVGDRGAVGTFQRWNGFHEHFISTGLSLRLNGVEIHVGGSRFFDGRRFGHRHFRDHRFQDHRFQDHRFRDPRLGDHRFGRHHFRDHRFRDDRFLHPRFRDRRFDERHFGSPHFKFREHRDTWNHNGGSLRPWTYPLTPWTYPLR